MRVEMVGGPMDGQRWEIQGGRALVIPLMPDIWAMLEEADPSFARFDRVEMPIRQTRDGFRVYWTERIEG